MHCNPDKSFPDAQRPNGATPESVRIGLQPVPQFRLRTVLVPLERSQQANNRVGISRPQVHIEWSAIYRQCIGGSGKELYSAVSGMPIIRLMSKNSFGAASTLRVDNDEYRYFRLAALEKNGIGNIGRLPFSTKILLENLLRQEDGRRVSAADIEYVAGGAASRGDGSERNQFHARARATAGFHRACPAWWTWPPCATPWPPWAATPAAPIR